MTTSEFLTHLRSLGAELRVDGDRLNCTIPKALLTPDLSKELKERKTEILEFLKRADATVSAREPRLQPIPRDGALPLSFAQQRLWFLDQYEPDKAFYNIPFGLHLSGPLNVAALDQSLNEIIRRHEMLRTTFSVLDGEPVQIIAAPVNRSLTVVDLSDRSASEREDEAQYLISKEARRSFDLARGPLFRTTLIRLDENDHVLLLTLHHIVSDGWSIGVLYGELWVLYEAFSCSQPSPLPELAIQYADYAVWQRQWLTGEALEPHLSYWHRQLEGAPALLNLPTDHPRPAVQTHHGACRDIELAKELTDRLKALSRKEGVTLFMTLLAAFQTLLHRYSGQNDIVVGSPIANRHRTEIEGLIGFFVNTLVLRTDFSGNPTFLEMLQRVRKSALEAYEHQELPFEKLVEELKPERSLSYSPFFQVVFVLHNAPADPHEIFGLVVNAVKLENDTSRFDLSLSMIEGADELKGSWEYSTDLFDEETIVRINGHFCRLLEGIVANPDQSVSELPMLTEPEKHKLLIEWNDTKREYPTSKCIHELFEEQVKRTPEAVAVVFEDKRLTYRELNQRANQVARFLIKLGARSETLVGICMERSLEMIVAILGILKAGSAYVPLDPHYPRERLAFMVDDAQIAILLTQARLIENEESRAGNRDCLSSIFDPQVRVICLDSDSDVITQESTKNPAGVVMADNLAYVIYTSGSTGRPKGVMVRQLGLLNVIQTQIRVFGVQPNSRVLQFASLSFDASISEIMMALCAGATLCLGRREDLLPGEPLVRFLVEHSITHCTLPPSAVATMPSHPLPSLTTFTVAGEICSAELVARWAPNRRFFNLYGPTEASIWTAGLEWTENGEAPPIGKPIANAKLHILDANLQPVPVEVPGELYIGGIGLARGYLHRPDLTAEKFIPDPFNAEPGWRLYKTGDRARYRVDGNVDFIGRIDHQVKLRGFRIELGEIEAVLSEQPQVRHSVVLAREDVPGDKRLTAYIVLDEGTVARADKLHRSLRAKLPEYMVPSAYVFLESLPLTSNGKVDRKALPAPDRTRAEPEESFVAPRTPVEEMLAKIWAEVLRLDRVGIRDNFFDLGGHSLLATQVMARVRSAFQVDVPLRALFEKPTVGELATVIAGQKAIELDGEEFSSTLAELESLSEEETQRLLLEQGNYEGMKGE